MSNRYEVSPALVRIWMEMSQSKDVSKESVQNRNTAGATASGEMSKLMGSETGDGALKTGLDRLGSGVRVRGAGVKATTSGASGVAG